MRATKGFFVFTISIGYVSSLLVALFLLADNSYQYDTRQTFTQSALTTDDILTIKLKKLARRETPPFSQMTQIPERKAAFFDYLLPHIQLQNIHERRNRKILKAISEDFLLNQSLSKARLKQLEKLEREYQIDEDFPERTIETSLRHLSLRIGQIPASMVLAQAANESAWGTSRFAEEGNNYFGQWCFDRGCGLVPDARGDGDTHEVAKFNSTGKSVASYFRNINTHRAYRELRRIRQQLRNDDQVLKGLRLIEGLNRYSEKGGVYIKELAQLIRFNKLQRFDVPPAAQLNAPALNEPTTSKALATNP